LKGFISVLR